MAVRYVKAIVLMLKKEFEQDGNKKNHIKFMLHILNKRIEELQKNEQGVRLNQQRKKEEEELKPEYYRALIESKDNNVAMMQHGGAEILNKGSEKARKKRRLKAAVWRKKVARYLAYCVDGGLL